MERYLSRMEKTFWRLAVSHAVSPGNREASVALNFISERTVQSMQSFVAGCYLSGETRVCMGPCTRKLLFKCTENDRVLSYVSKCVSVQTNEMQWIWK
jgi:hypothetical protein